MSPASAVAGAGENATELRTPGSRTPEVDLPSKTREGCFCPPLDSGRTPEEAIDSAGATDPETGMSFLSGRIVEGRGREMLAGRDTLASKTGFGIEGS